MADVFLSIGSNVNKEFYIAAGLSSLQAEFGKLAISSLYECSAVGFEGADFYNLVVGFETSLSLIELAEKLRQIEFEHGRDHQAKKYSPRTLDLDILLYDTVIADSPVQIPRQEIQHNAFVLWPLAELAGHLIHPVLGNTYQQLWQTFDKSKQQIIQKSLTPVWENNTVKKAL